MIAGRPGGDQVIFEPDISQFREFESTRVHTTCTKAQQRELATVDETVDEKSTSSGIAEPYILKARTGGEKGQHL